MRLLLLILGTGLLLSIFASSERALATDGSESTPSFRTIAEESVPSPQADGQNTLDFAEIEPAAPFLVGPVRVRGEFLWLQPDAVATTPIADQVQTNLLGMLFRANVGATTPDSSAPAGRLTLELPRSSCHSYELTGFYLGGPDRNGRSVSNFDSTFFLDAGAVDPLMRGPLSNLPANFPTQADSLLLDFRFQSWGLSAARIHNWYSPGDFIDNFSVGIGPRYLRLIEKMDLRVIDEVNGRTGLLAVDAENDLFGVEVLARTRMTVIEDILAGWVELRVGLMINSITNRTKVSAGGGVSQSGSSSLAHFSPVIEGNILVDTITWRSLRFFAGYQFLYLPVIDRAGSQIAADVNFFLQANSNLESIFLHGPRVGMICTY